jgi:uncharacterized protein (TIGR02145 family)
MKTPVHAHRIGISLTMVVMVLLAPAGLNAQDKGAYKDLRDGREYKWSKIGNQAWMIQNLNFKAPDECWNYNNDSTNGVNFGRLYSWKAAQAACPKGWHLPSEKEWNALTQSLGASAPAGEKLQKMDTIDKTKVVTMASIKGTLSTLLAGVRHPDGTWTGIGVWGGCWSSGKVSDTVGSNVLFAKGAKDIVVSSNDKRTGFSVRCVRNK